MSIIFNSTSPDLPLKFFDIGTQWNQHKVYRPEGFAYFHWLQTDFGVGIVKINNQTIKLLPHQGFLIRPNVPHSYIPDSTLNKWQTSFITFEGNAAVQISQFLDINEYQIYDQLDSELDYFIAKHFDLFGHFDNESMLKQSTALYQFLMLLKRNATHQNNLITEDRVVNNILDYLRNNYRQQITNEDISHIAEYSESHTIKIFRDKMGQTPLEYLTHFRLRTAKSLLIFQPNLTIKEVATMVGYTNSSYFVQLFKKNFKRTPGHLRHD